MDGLLQNAGKSGRLSRRLKKSSTVKVEDEINETVTASQMKRANVERDDEYRAPAASPQMEAKIIDAKRRILTARLKGRQKGSQASFVTGDHLAPVIDLQAVRLSRAS